MLHMSLMLCLQILELMYLCYKASCYYVAIIAAPSLAGLMLLVIALKDQHKKLARLVKPKHVVPIVQRGWVTAALSYKLVPGDVIVLQKGKAMCDMVVLCGSCIVEESMLSGEVFSPCSLLLSACSFSFAS